MTRQTRRVRKRSTQRHQRLVLFEGVILARYSWQRRWRIDAEEAVENPLGPLSGRRRRLVDRIRVIGIRRQSENASLREQSGALGTWPGDTAILRARDIRNTVV